MQKVHVFSTHDKDISIHGQPSIRINDSLHTVEHRLARVGVLGSTFGIISILFLLCFSISPKQIKLESCTCAQIVRHEILIPAVVNSLSFHCGKMVKIKSKPCYPHPISYFFFINGKIKQAASGCAHLKQSNSLILFDFFFL